MHRINNIVTFQLILFCIVLTDFSFAKSIPTMLNNYIADIHVDAIGKNQPTVKFKQIKNDLIQVTVSAILNDSVRLDDWRLTLTPSFKPSSHWTPHLSPTDSHIVAQHVFRAPALIMSDNSRQITVIPDLDILKKGSPVDWYMDINAINNKMTLGMSQSAVKEHVLFVRKPGGVYPPGPVEFGFYILTDDKSTSSFNPWRKPLDFFWQKWGAPLFRRGEPLMSTDMLPYVNHTYNWAFSTWRSSTWQQFELNGKQVGAPAFIVNVTQSPNYPGELNEREFRSIWNQAWFNSLRSAQGLYRYAKRYNRDDLLSYALKTKELALSFPMREGFFHALIATEMEDFKKGNEIYSRSKGWRTYYFGNSNRNPFSSNPKEAPFHILDMSYTAWLMLTWYEELQRDDRLLEYATSYADALIKLQDKDGFFPAWLSLNSLEPLSVLKQSPETAMSVTFLIKMFQLTKNRKYRDIALKSMDAVIRRIVLNGQWEDFETYWSCSSLGKDDLVGKKVTRNNMFKQNTFSMYWVAEALLNCFEVTRHKRYLSYGQRTLDELLMAQAIWQPPYIHVPALGGFGVMNADAEWNDARQSLFSELIIRYGKQLKCQEYIERGISALRASFVMMYAPENKKTKKQWELAWNFFGKEDYGFMMENYGHGGETNAQGLGMGEFTIYDWGNGAASEAYNRIVDHYGDEFLKNQFLRY